MVTMDHNQLWQKVLGEVELQISRPNFITWFKNSSIMDHRDGVITVGLPNNFAREWVETKYHKIILGTLRTIDSGIRKVEFTLVKDSFKKEAPAARPAHLASQLIFNEFSIDPNTNLNPTHTINSFIVGSSNELAYAAGMGVLKEIGTKYNPLFIYGGVGVGKTHLMQALGNEAVGLSHNKVKVKYVTSEKFTNDVIWAMKSKRMETIKEKYRLVDFLIIDDIQFIAGKARTEEEFFHTFNALYQQNKQIIISSDRSPKFIPVLEERLRSRFEGGMIVDIGYPDFELKVAVLRAKLIDKKSSLPDEVINEIAVKVKRGFRELEGILNKILFYQQVKNMTITVDVARHIIAEVVKTPQKNMSPEFIIKTVAEFFEVSVDDVLSHSRKQQVVEPRQIAIYLLRDMLDLSYPFIGEKLGKRDHTTVLYAFEKISQELTRNQTLNQKILSIKEMLHKAYV
jgi:chromosomal replication initiator protein